MQFVDAYQHSFVAEPDRVVHHELKRYVERVAELMLNKFNGLYGTKIEHVKHRYKENTRRTRTECYPGVLIC